MIFSAIQSQAEFRLQRDSNLGHHDPKSRGQLFVCVEVLRPSQPIGTMLSAVSLSNHTFTGQA